MNKMRIVGVLLIASTLVLAGTGTVWAFPPLPSSFYGEIHISDGAPTTADQVEAFVPGVSGAVGVGAVRLYLGQLVYSLDVYGDDDGTPAKEGGDENDLVTFKINGRVVATGIWHGGTNVRLHLHPSDANPGGPYSVAEGASVTLDAIGTTDWLAGEARTYAWDLDNDGQYDDATGVTTSFSRPDEGSFLIGLKVTDAQGGESFDTATVAVSNVAPVVNAGADATLNEGGTFAQSGSFTDPGTDTWEATVNYGDGSGAQPLALSGKTFSLSHVYADDGAYIVTVTVTDDDGGVGTDTVAVGVSNVVPVVNMGVNATINEGSTFTRAGSFTDPGADTWTAIVNYGDGSGAQPLALNPDKTFSLSHVYADNGSYTVLVTVTDDNGYAGSDTVLVTVNNVVPTVNAGADATLNEGGTFARAGSFTDPGADTWTATVNYDDGSGPQPLTIVGKTFSLSHVYADNGTYDVVVTVTDDNGGVGSDTVVVTVNNVAPVVNAGADQTASEGALVTLTGSFTDVGLTDTHTYNWAFGDGSPAANTLATTHIYAAPGTYTARLTVTDDDGGSAFDELIVTVSNVPPTNLDAHGPYAGIAGQSVALTGSATCVSVDACVFAWDLDGDGQYDDATGPTPSYIWYTIGVRTISLRVTDEEGTFATDIATVNITGATHSITLVPGWNLVSFNVHPVSTAIADVLASVTGNFDLVYAWDAPTQKWLKYDNVPMSGDDLLALDEKMGFWIHMTAADTLEVVGSVPTTTSIPMYTTGQGWNLVGYPSAVTRSLPGALAGVNFSLVYAYRANDGADPWKMYDVAGDPWANDLTDIAPGWGYWVKVNSAGTWNVSYP